jgi:hypothetical protein
MARRLIDMIRSPITLRVGQRPARRRDHLAAALAMAVIPGLLGLTVAYVGGGCHFGRDAFIYFWWCVFPATLAFGGALSIPALVVALPIMVWFRRQGYGGFLFPMALGAFLAAIVGLVLIPYGELLPVFLVCGAIYGVLYWSVMTWLCAKAENEIGN